MKYWRKRDNWILKLLIKTCTLYAHYKIRRHDHEHLVSTGHLAGISLQAWQLTRDICVQQGVGGRILLRFQSLSRPVNRNYSESRPGYVNPTLWLNRGSRHEVDSFFFFFKSSRRRSGHHLWLATNANERNEADATNHRVYEKYTLEHSRRIGRKIVESKM